MTDVNVDKDYDNLALVVTCEFAAPLEKVWQLWADPRKLERWWGPPGFPATVTAHELSPGGEVHYFMTGPEGDKFGGYWKVLAVEPTSSIDLEDGFADPDGTPVDSMPVGKMRIDLTEQPTGTRMRVRTTYGSRADLDKVLEMGMAEGMTSAIGQIDAILAE